MEASAPGKVLILGGYLVVEAPNVGVSIGVSARFRAVARQPPSARRAHAGDADDKSAAAAAARTVVVRIHSPQFRQQFDFACTFATHSGDDDTDGGDDGDAVTATQTAGPRSAFLHYAVLYAVAAAHMLGGVTHACELALELLADNDFYSQRNYLEQRGEAVTTAALRALPPHVPLVGAVSKTGLGSSAAMTTSVVACVLGALCMRASNSSSSSANSVSDADEASSSLPPRELVHRLAQLAHSVAQGKIGSGFDVFTAVYGTCAYRRFSVEHVHALMQHASSRHDKDNNNNNNKPCGNDEEAHAKSSSTTTAAAAVVAVASVAVAQLRRCVDLSREWVRVEAFALPRGVQLVLGDVHQGGSSTPGMVAKVMQWRRRVADDAASAWEQLRRNNDAYVAQLRRLHALSGSSGSEDDGDAAAYDVAWRALQTVSHLDKATSHPCASATRAAVREAAQALLDTTHCAARGRALLRDIGVAAGVAIEPPELTCLLDATAALPGVLAVGCPGAGGYDAVFALVLGESCRAAVEAYWSAYTPMTVCPLLVREGSAGLTMTRL